MLGNLFNDRSINGNQCRFKRTILVIPNKLSFPGISSELPSRLFRFEFMRNERFLALRPRQPSTASVRTTNRAATNHPNGSQFTTSRDPSPMNSTSRIANKPMSLLVQWQKPNSWKWSFNCECQEWLPLVTEICNNCHSFTGWQMEISTLFHFYWARTRRCHSHWSSWS